METTTDALKSQLESIERELMQLNVRRQQAPVKGAVMKAVSPITRKGFIMAQERGRPVPPEMLSPVAPIPSAGRKTQDKPNDDYLMDLIARPRPSRSQSRTRPPLARRKGTSDCEDLHSHKPGSNASHNSSDMDERTTMTRSIQDRFESKLNAEKQRMDREFGLVLDKLRQELDDARHKRLCERDAFRETKERLEREIRDMRYQVDNAEVSARTSQQEATILKVQVEELRAELKQANCEFERMELRCAKMCEGNDDTVSRLKQEKNKIENLMAEKERELINLSRENAKWRRREEEVLSKGIILADRNAELAREVNGLRDSIDDMKLKSANERERHEEKVAELNDECQELQSLLTDCKQSNKQYEDRVANLSRDISRLRDENSQTSNRCEVLERELKQHRRASDENSALRAERLALDAKCHQQQDEILRLQDALTNRDRELERLRLEVREADNRCCQLSRQMDLQLSRQPVAASGVSRTREVDLIDNEATPLSKLGKCPRMPQQAERPNWWHQLDDTPNDNSALNRRRTPERGFFHNRELTPDDNMRNRKPTLLPTRSAPAAVSDDEDDLQIVMPLRRKTSPKNERRERVPLCAIPNTSDASSSLELLKCEKKDLCETLHQLPRNSAFRTSEQNEQWQALQDRIREVENDLTTLTIDREIS